jgi:recombination protein RecA
MKIGVMFGNPETTTGGNALKFYSSIRLDVRRIGAIQAGEEVVGNRTAVKVVKNKMAPPFAKVEFDLLYGEGISAEGDILDIGVKKEMIEKSGAWYSIKGERMGQGRDQAKQYLKEHPALMIELRAKILEAYNIGQKGAATKSAAVQDLITKSESVNTSNAVRPGEMKLSGKTEAAKPTPVKTAEKTTEKTTDKKVTAKK